jgi:hypothetical protein
MFFSAERVRLSNSKREQKNPRHPRHPRSLKNPRDPCSFPQISQSAFGWAIQKQNKKIRGIHVFFPQIFAEEPQISQSAFGWVIQKENKKIRVIRVIRVP